MPEQAGKSLGRRPIGRPVKYDPEALLDKFSEYCKWCEENPMIGHKVLSDGILAPYPIKRPMTIQSFCVFAGMLPDTFNDYEKKEPYFRACAHVRTCIESNQLEGAMANVYNPMIAARVLKLKEQTDVTTAGKQIQQGPTVIKVAYNDEEIDISGDDI